MPEIKVSDAVAVHAAKILEKYCETRDCENCVFCIPYSCENRVFYNQYSCQFRDGVAPLHWTVPTGFEEVALLVGETEHE